LRLDSHVDIPWPNRGDFLSESARCVDLPKLLRGGVNAVCFAAYVPQERRDAEGHQRAAARSLAMLDEIRAMGTVAGTALACSTHEIGAAVQSGKIAVIPAVENGTGVGGDPALLDAYAALGVRYMTLTHNGHNDLADSAIPRRDLGDASSEHGGLSTLGRTMIRRMNRLGILVDVSHASKPSMMQAVALSTAPIVATHSCARALCHHPRNLDDEQLLALRDHGGVVQVTMVSAFLRAGARTADIGVEVLVDHIDYIINLIGIDHVGIGTDFDGGGMLRGCSNAAEAPAITAELVRRGYGEDAIEKIWGGNFLRALAASEPAGAAQVTAPASGIG
jgi:membrane dipeptidase